MGYSNNKWRKILTILMIINLCFILFAKFSKVFGSSSPSLTTVTINENTYDLDLSYLTSQYNYYFLCWKNESGGAGYYYTYLDLFCSNKEMTFYKNGKNRSVYIADGSDFIYFHVFRTSDSSYSYENAVSSWNNTVFNPSLNTHTYINDNGVQVTQTVTTGYSSNYMNIAYSNYDVKDQNNNVIFNNNAVSYPFFDNVTEIENGNPDGVFISPGDYSKDDNLYFHLLEITNGLANGDSSLYYYTDKIFLLNKDSDFYSTWVDPSIDGFYYYIPRYKLGLSQNTSYLYVLNNSKNQIQNSYGVYEKDVSNGIYDVVESDTTGVITATEEENDRMKNIQSSIIENQETTNNINNFLNENTVSSDTQTDVDNNLNFNNSSPQFAELQTNFFSRLSNIIGDFGNYSLDTIDTINIPIPHSNQSIAIRSDLMISYIPNDIKFIITAFWCFIFGKYFLNYLLLIYKLITTGQLIDYYSSNDEIIVANVL